MVTYFPNTADADALAATLPTKMAAAYVGVTDPAARAALLLQASDDVDHAMRYQGRRYDTATQLTEFPRVAYEPSNAIYPTAGAAGVPGGSSWGSQVWDLDPVTFQPVVPPAVLSAVLYQASYLAGGESPDADDQHKGINSQGEGSARQSAELNNAFNKTGLCRRAWRVLWRYRLVSGRLM